jgi:diazepam-binding inhibitor (GABA receptor modulating acyl-CoA-binding protein)
MRAWCFPRSTLSHRPLYPNPHPNSQFPFPFPALLFQLPTSHRLTHIHQPLKTQADSTPHQGKAKKRAWQAVVDKGTTQDEAQAQYVKLVEELKEKYGYDASKSPEAVGSS